MWVSHPEQRQERIRRAFLWWRKNSADQDARGTFGSFGPQFKGREAINNLRPEWRSANYSSTLVMRDLQAETDLGLVYDAWNYASGIAHGRPWALFTDFTPIEATDDGCMYVRLGGDPELARRSLLLAGSVTRRIEWHWYANHQVLSRKATRQRFDPALNEATAFLRGTL